MSSKEIWKDITGYEGLYQVSNFGRVKSLNYDGSKRAKVMVPYDVHGYKRVKIFKNKQKISIGVHRLVAQAFIPNFESKSQVNHINGDKSDNTLRNLEWVTGSENILHAYRTLGYKASGGVPKRRVKNIDTGDVFPSVKQAAISTNTNRTSIISCCKGRYQLANGQRWEYL